MIDSKFIIKYTNALYSTPPEFAPRYDEFRDMFSSGQIYSKEWIVDELVKLRFMTVQSVIIAGAWYGTLGIMLKDKFPDIDMTFLDMDPRCEKFIHNIVYADPTMKCITDDMYRHSYTEGVIINTSCEHIEDIQQWLSLLPSRSIVVLQSNNYLSGAGHINCVNSKEAFIEQTGLTDVLYAGELEMPMYTRYMVIAINK